MSEKEKKKKKKSKVDDDEDEEEVVEEKVTKKKKKKPKEDEEEESEEKSRKKTKLKVEKTDSEEESKDDKKTKKESKIESRVTSKPNSDLEKAVLDIPDPMKDKDQMKLLKRIISHLCLLVLILALRNVIMGIVAAYFYDEKTHLVWYGGLCLFQLVGAPIGWLAIRWGNRTLFLTCVIINLVWIVSVVILMITYMIIGGHEFKQEIALHVGVIFFLSASITLGVCCLLMMQRLDMINITYKKPEVYISAEGKASEKAKLKKKSTA